MISARACGDGSVFRREPPFERGLLETVSEITLEIKGKKRGADVRRAAASHGSVDVGTIS